MSVMDEDNWQEQLSPEKVAFLARLQSWEDSAPAREAAKREVKRRVNGLS